MTQPTLEALISRARRLDVRPDHAERHVAELSRWARHEPERRRRWMPWLAGGIGFAAVAAALVIMALHRDPTVRDGEPVRLGDRVVIVAEPATSYRVVATDPDRTELVVERGTVTARLFPGTRSHSLALRGHGIEATATGTVYSLTVDERGGVVAVHEGTVLVRDGGAKQAVVAGETWPAHAAGAGIRAARRLLAMAAPAVSAVDVSAPAPAPVPPVSSTPLDAGTVTDVIVARPKHPDRIALESDGGTPDLRELWRVVRLHRGQGKFDEAFTECLAIAAARDHTWSPIALLEAARIQLGPLSSPEQTVGLVERFEREWPTHDLGPEARELRCRALRQLGRGDACAPHDAAP